MGIFIRGFLEIMLFTITLPIRIVLVLIWFITYAIWVLLGGGSIKDYWKATNSKFYSNLKREIEWIKTGKLEEES